MWLAKLGAHGMVRASFVPPAPIRALRDLPRLRSPATAPGTSTGSRSCSKTLDIKLSSVATDIMGVSGRLMMDAFIDGDATIPQ